MGSLYTPVIANPEDDEERIRGHANFFHSAIYHRFDKGPRRRYQPRSLGDIAGAVSDAFAEDQIRWCSAAIEVAARQGDRPLQLFQGENSQAYLIAWYQ